MGQQNDAHCHSAGSTRAGATESRASRKSRPANLPSLRNKALGLLARREHSRHELYQKLKQSAINPSAADSSTAEPSIADARVENVDREQELVAVLDTLIEQGLLSDERFTEAYVNMRARKGYGPQRISMELAEKGVTPDLAQVYLDERDDWAEQLAQTWRKKFRRPPTDFAEKAKQMRFLQYRGYYPDQIRDFIDSLAC